MSLFLIDPNNWSWHGNTGGGAAAAAGYVGPGDLAGISYDLWVGLRAYSAAKAAAQTPLIHIVDNSNLNGTDINCLTTGFIDAATLNTWIGAHGTANVTIWYDQAGSNNLLHSTFNGFIPVISTSAGTFPGSYGFSINFVGKEQLITAGNVAAATPASIYAVARSPATSSQIYIGNFGGTNLIGFGPTTNLALISNGLGANVTSAATDGSFYAMQGMFTVAGTSSLFQVDGNAPASGTTAVDTFGAATISLGTSSSQFGQAVEFGFKSGTDLSAQFNAISSNIHGANGYNF